MRRCLERLRGLCPLAVLSAIVLLMCVAAGASGEGPAEPEFQAPNETDRVGGGPSVTVDFLFGEWENIEEGISIGFDRQGQYWMAVIGSKSRYSLIGSYRLISSRYALLIVPKNSIVGPLRFLDGGYKRLVVPPIHSYTLAVDADEGRLYLRNWGEDEKIVIMTRTPRGDRVEKIKDGLVGRWTGEQLDLRATGVQGVEAVEVLADGHFRMTGAGQGCTYRVLSGDKVLIRYRDRPAICLFRLCGDELTLTPLMSLEEGEVTLVLTRYQGDDQTFEAMLASTEH